MTNNAGRTGPDRRIRTVASVAVLVVMVLTGAIGCSTHHLGKSSAASSGSVPAQARHTLSLIDAGQWSAAAHAPGTNGGTVFRNNEHNLPAKDSRGRRVTYREWDVNPKRPGHSRDAERIVTGSDGSAWYTNNHYRSFVKIRGPNR